jgi:hypothetical protein
MGVYHYFLRRKVIKAPIEGEIVPVHSFSFAFKYHYHPEDERRQFLIAETARRSWENKELPKYCFLGDMPTKEERAKGWIATVYTDLTNYGWVDTNKFPGRAVGGLSVEGRKVAFLNARDYLIKEYELSVKAMMCSPDQPAIAQHRKMIKFLEDVKMEPGVIKDVEAWRRLAYDAVREAPAAV